MIDCVDFPFYCNERLARILYGVCYNQSMEVEISRMKESELGQVARIFRTVFNATGEEWTEESVKGHIKENYFEKYHYVARCKGRIVGFLMAIPLTREKGMELFIDSIAVLPDFQKKEVGRKLWEKAIASAKENNLVGIRLLSNPRLPSYKWYKDMGYIESGWVELHKPLS